MIIFVTGGARSGKSDFAQRTAEGIAGKRLYLATAEALDEEMAERIEKHRESRAGLWDTIEEPLMLGKALRGVFGAYDVILVDCVTLWVSNLLGRLAGDEEKMKELLDDGIDALGSHSGTVIFVSNEVGMGIVPENGLARHYRDMLGRVNQWLAERADTVYFMCAGIPMKIK